MSENTHPNEISKEALLLISKLKNSLLNSFSRIEILEKANETGRQENKELHQNILDLQNHYNQANAETEELTIKLTTFQGQKSLRETQLQALLDEAKEKNEAEIDLHKKYTQQCQDEMTILKKSSLEWDRERQKFLSEQVRLQNIIESQSNRLEGMSTELSEVTTALMKCTEYQQEFQSIVDEIRNKQCESLQSLMDFEKTENEYIEEIAMYKARLTEAEMAVGKYKYEKEQSEGFKIILEHELSTVQKELSITQQQVVDVIRDRKDIMEYYVDKRGLQYDDYKLDTTDNSPYTNSPHINTPSLQIYPDPHLDIDVDAIANITDDNVMNDKVPISNDSHTHQKANYKTGMSDISNPEQHNTSNTKPISLDNQINTNISNHNPTRSFTKTSPTNTTSTKTALNKTTTTNTSLPTHKPTFYTNFDFSHPDKTPDSNDNSTISLKYSNNIDVSAFENKNTLQSPVQSPKATHLNTNVTTTITHSNISSPKDTSNTTNVSISNTNIEHQDLIVNNINNKLTNSNTLHLEDEEENLFEHHNMSLDLDVGHNDTITSIQNINNDNQKNHKNTIDTQSYFTSPSVTTHNNIDNNPNKANIDYLDNSPLSIINSSLSHTSVTEDTNSNESSLTTPPQTHNNETLILNHPETFTTFTSHEDDTTNLSQTSTNGSNNSKEIMISASTSSTNTSDNKTNNIDNTSNITNTTSHGSHESEIKSNGNTSSTLSKSPITITGNSNLSSPILNSTNNRFSNPLPVLTENNNSNSISKEQINTNNITGNVIEENEMEDGLEFTQTNEDLPVKPMILHNQTNTDIVFEEENEDDKNKSTTFQDTTNNIQIIEEIEENTNHENLIYLNNDTTTSNSDLEGHEIHDNTSPQRKKPRFNNNENENNNSLTCEETEKTVLLQTPDQLTIIESEVASSSDLDILNDALDNDLLMTMWEKREKDRISYKTKHEQP